MYSVSRFVYMVNENQIMYIYIYFTPVILFVSMSETLAFCPSLAVHSTKQYTRHMGHPLLHLYSPVLNSASAIIN